MKQNLKKQHVSIPFIIHTEQFWKANINLLNSFEACGIILNEKCHWQIKLEIITII